MGSATESPQRHPQCAAASSSAGSATDAAEDGARPPPHANSSSRPPYWAAGGSGSAHANQPRRFPRRLKHYSDAGYINLLAPLALLPAATHARRTLRALVIGGGAGEVTKLPTARCSSVP